MSIGVPELETKRLVLRHWLDEDLESWVALNQDPEVMEFFPASLSREEALTLATNIQSNLERSDRGLWAVEVKGGERFIGFVGLSVQDLGLDFTPCTEVGWRLKRSAWGQGYATEAAKAALRYGLGELDLEVIYSFTAATNLRSQAVMERIGMHPRPELAFIHPRLDPESPLASHITFATRPSASL